jgi:formate hydrogenlyase subunit 3/multisubunit Na+/H+ antiporter MnhD subunit
MSLVIGLSCIAALFVVMLLGLATAQSPGGTPVVYGASCTISVVACAAALVQLLGVGAAAPTIVLPLGLPWIGMHFRLDALAAFFLTVVNLGGAVASFYALGYGRHETAPHRVLPFYPAFLAGMNLVVLADDAFTFLLCWEFMSLSSWALVMAHHRDADNARAGYIYLVDRKAATPLPRFARAATRQRSPRSFSLSRSWARDRRLGWCRCMSGCPWRIRLRRAMSRH